MKTLTLIPMAILGCSLWANRTCAQVTNPPPLAPLTKLESFNTNIGGVVLKASTDVGTASGNAGIVTVRCKETTDAKTGHIEQGIAVVITLRGQPNDTMLMDYDEIIPLLNAIDYLGKLDINVTSFNSLDAEYTTKSGFHIAAVRTRQTGAIQCSVRDFRTGSAPVIFSWQQMVQLSGLVTRAKEMLDSSRGG